MTIGRAQHTLTFPANLMLVVDMNPCPSNLPKAARRTGKADGIHPPKWLEYLSDKEISH